MTYRYNSSWDDARLGLNHPLAHMRLAYVRGLKELDINQSLIEKCLSHQDVHIRFYMAVKCIREYAGSFPLNQEQFKRGLLDRDMSVRSVFADCMDWQIGKDDIDAAFKLAKNSQSSLVYVENIMKRPDFNPTDEQCDIGVSHSTDNIRLLMTRAANFKPTAEQIAVGLKDSIGRVREWYAARKDFTPSIDQVNFAIEYDLMFTGIIYINRDDCEFSKEQHNDWLMNGQECIKCAIAKHHGFLPTLEQIEYGLSYSEKYDWYATTSNNSNDKNISKIFESRLDEWRNKEERLKLNKMVVDSMKNEKTASTRGVL